LENAQIPRIMRLIGEIIDRNPNRYGFLPYLAAIFPKQTAIYTTTAAVIHISHVAIFAFR
jgi:hypothetical protein